MTPRQRQRRPDFPAHRRSHYRLAGWRGRGRRPYQSTIRRGEASLLICATANWLSSTKGHPGPRSTKSRRKPSSPDPTVSTTVGSEPIDLKIASTELGPGKHQAWSPPNRARGRRRPRTGLGETGIANAPMRGSTLRQLCPSITGASADSAHRECLVDGAAGWGLCHRAGRGDGAAGRERACGLAEERPSDAGHVEQHPVSVAVHGSGQGACAADEVAAAVPVCRPGCRSSAARSWGRLCGGCPGTGGRWRRGGRGFAGGAW